MKKALSLILVLMMMLGVMPITGLAVEETGKAEVRSGYTRLKVQMERGSVKTTYDLGYSSDLYNNYVRTAFDIKTGGAARVSIEEIAVSHGSIYIQFFASDYSKISSVSYTDEAEVSVPKNCDFLRVEIRTTTNLESIALRFYDGNGTPKEAKRSGISEVSEKLTYKVSDDVHTTSRLMLPPNYSIDGEKVPLILWLEGSGSGLSTWTGDFNKNKLPYLEYLRDEGFAVFSVYAWGNQYAEKYPNCGKSFPYPIPINLSCIKAGIEYICDRYNIDADNIHIMSKSQGGQCALYYASCNELNVKSIGMFAPVLDYLSMPGEALYKDTRAAIADELNFTGDVEYFASDRFLSYSDEGRAFLRENLSKLLILNEAWTNLTGATPEELFESSMDDCETFWTEKIWKTDRTDIYTHTDYVKTASVPVKIWGAKDDASTPYLKMVEVVAQLKNGGSVAELRTLPNETGGHSCADVGSTRVNVTTALGIKHNNVPIGWVENVQWIRQQTQTHTHDYKSTVIAPTCTEQGYTVTTCTSCGDTKTTNNLASLGHDYSGTVTVVAPTCKEQGYTATACTRCDSVNKTNFTDTIAHKMVLIPASDPTCEKPGLTAGTACQYCGLVGVAQNETGSALGGSCDYSADPTTCANCGYVRADMAIANVVLRSSCSGLYFKGSFTFGAHETASRYGIAVSVYNKLPVADDSDETSLYTIGENSVLISNILGEGKNGKTLIYARPYVLLEDGTYIYGDVVATNLKAVVETIDAQLEGFAAVQKEALIAMYRENSAVMQDWLIPEIKKYV